MVVGETVIAAGIGCKRGASGVEVSAAVETALETHGLEMTALSALATARMKQGEAGIIVAGAALGLPVILVDEAALKEMEARTLSQSAQSLAAAGTPSVSEAAALAAAGEGSRLLGPRIVVGNVTCALAIGGDGA